MACSRLLPLLSGVVCAVGLLMPARAFAQNPAAAEALFEQARAAMAAGSFEIACARFRDSDKLDPAVGTRFNLADCEEKRGRLATAWSLFRGVLSELAQDDDRRPIADERAAKLKPRLPIVTLVLPAETPRGTRVRVDGVELGEASFGVPLPMDPGPHGLSLLAPNGGKEQRTTFTLREGEKSELPLRFQTEAEAEAAESTAGPNDTQLIPTFGSNRRRWGLLAGGVGVAGAAFGTVAGVITLSKKSTADANCNDRLHTCNQAGVDANESGKTFAALSSIGFGLGVVGLATGAYLLLTTPAAQPQGAKVQAAHPSTPASLPRNLRAELTLERGRGFVSVAGRF